METVMEDQEDEFAGAEEVLDISQLCRACASPNEYLIPIFHGEGLQYDLKHKVSRLPLQIKETDKLPVQLCYQCASTLIAFSDLVEGCAEADAKLKSLLPEGSSDPTTSLDDQTGLQSDEKSLGLQSSAASSIVETSQKVSPELNAEGVAEQDVSSMDQEDIAIEPMQQRSKAHFGNRAKLRNQTLKANPATFCVNCGKVNASFSEFINHMRTDHKIKCEKCFAKFVTKDHLSKHLTIYHSEESAECKKSFETQKFNKPEKPTESEKSAGCEKSTDNEKVTNREKSIDLEKHSEPEKSTELKCKKKKLCQSTSSSHSTDDDSEDDDPDFNWPLDVEIQEEQEPTNQPTETPQPSTSSTTPESGFPCDNCNKSFPTLLASLQHQIRLECGKVKSSPPVHAKKKSKKKVRVFKCEVCSETFRSSLLLTKHMRLKHTGELPYMCETCGKRFPVKRTLKDHACPNIEHPRPHKCEHCGKTFMKRGHLTSHRTIHTGEDPFVCNICGKTFRTKHSSWYHKRIHEDVRPFVCTICGLRCLMKSTLNSHMRTHTGEKPFSCEICGKTFRIAVQRRNHIQVEHSGVKPYSCTVCGQSYPIKRSLVRHIQKKHSKSEEMSDDASPEEGDDDLMNT